MLNKYQVEIKLLNDLNFEIHRLGQIKNNMQKIEPFLRNTDFLSFDMSSVSSSSSAQSSNSPIIFWSVSCSTQV